MASYLITGAGRGLGLAFVRRLLALPSEQVGKIFAASRGQSADLDTLGNEDERVIQIRLDVTRKDTITQAATQVQNHLGGKGLDVLINNAGIIEICTNVASMDTEALEKCMHINVYGVQWVTQAFLPLLSKGSTKKVVNISTSVASIEAAREFHFLPAPAYKISKAALNALTVQYALDYEKEGFTFLSISPGVSRSVIVLFLLHRHSYTQTIVASVDLTNMISPNPVAQTDLGKGTGDLTGEEGAQAALDIILPADTSLNGKFLNISVKGWENHSPNRYDGKPVPW